MATNRMHRFIIVHVNPLTTDKFWHNDIGWNETEVSMFTLAETGIMSLPIDGKWAQVSIRIDYL